MTWGWAVKGDNLGTPAESAVKASWPDYNATYLSNKLHDAQRRFDPGPLDDGLHDIEKHVYLQESVKGYEAEAEACLKREFEEWLQGTHPANQEAELGYGHYVNGDGQFGPKRRHVYDGVVSAEMRDDQGGGHTGWRATRWGTKQLTHLDGVRDFLRAGKVAEDNASRDMNLLAERGPQDLNEAWMYFKHWVNKRPVQTCDEMGPPGYLSGTDRLNLWQVDRMNGTGPSNWNSQQPPAPSATENMSDDVGPGIADYYGLRDRNQVADITGLKRRDIEPTVRARPRANAAKMSKPSDQLSMDDPMDDQLSMDDPIADITGLKRRDIERASHRANAAKMSKPPDQLYTSRESASSRESKRRVGWGPTNAQQPPFRTSSLSTPSNPYGRMEYELKDGENARFNDDFKRDRAEMTGCVTKAMASADRVLAMRNCFEQR